MQRRNVLGLGGILLAAWFLWPSAPERWAVRNAPARSGVVVAFGDSLTAGFGAAPQESYPAELERLLGREIVNRGRNGDTAADALARLESDVLVLDPSLVLVTLGGNDVMRRVPVEETVSSLREIFTRLTARGAMVVYLGIDPPFVGPARTDAIRELCRELGVLHVDRVMAGLWGDPARMADRIHPNAAGYRVMAERVHEALAGHVPSRAGRS